MIVQLINKTKKCSSCNKVLDVTFFPKWKNRCCSKCSECESLRRKKYRDGHLKEEKENWKKYYEDNSEQLKEKRRRYYSKNKKIENEKARVRDLHRRKRDINYKIRTYLRSRLTRVLKGKSKVGSFVFDLGCGIKELRLYIESQFHSGMTWENYGSMWHIDHIIPLSFYNLEDRVEFLEACNYLNLQPLLKEENLRKNNKIYVDN